MQSGGRTAGGGYIEKHWRGELPLAQSFWLNLVGINFLFQVGVGISVAVTFAFSAPWLEGSGAFPLLAIFFAAFLVWLWGAVGAWRSADRYQSNPNAKIWGRLAHAVIVLHALSWFVQGKDLLDNAAIASNPAVQTSPLSDQPEGSLINQPIEAVGDVQSGIGDAEWPSAFETREFEGVSISLPREWQWTGEADSDALNTASEAMGENIGFTTAQGNNRILAAGNAFDDAKVSVATIRLSARSAAPTISQADLRQALTEPQEAIRNEIIAQGETIAEGMRSAFEALFFEAKDGGLRENGSVICIWTQFEYDIGKGPTLSDSWVCPASDRSIKLTTSYRKSRANVFAPVAEHVWQSIRVDRP